MPNTTAASQDPDTSSMATATPISDANNFDVCNGFGQDAFCQQLDAQLAPSHKVDAQLNLLGRPVQRLVQLIKELEQLGVETRNLPLPKIVVVGDQSAGKSSLIEGISGIKVPRSGGTCTRCPLQITLYSSEEDAPWSCTVSLQQNYSFCPDADITQSRYGKWREDHNPTTIPFAVVENKADLEAVISRAQWATLNPGDDPLGFLNAASLEEMPLKVDFSPNKVILDITAPSQPSLSFIDLPGIIRQTEAAKDKWLVNLVENFVIDYINQGNSLILLARSMESDFANSSAAALVDQCDGALQRTVGCLTKPDRLPEGTRTQVIRNVLSGEAFTVGHGYFVTRQPHQGQLNDGISADEARQMEDDFFNQSPWMTELRGFQDRFGTFKLRDSLSVKLTNQILVSLPAIDLEVNARLQEVENELAGYPDPPENALGRVFEALTMFTTSLEKHAQGIHPYNDLRNALKELAKGFHDGLNKLRPTVVVSTPEKYRQSVDVPIFSLVTDDESDATPCPQTKSVPQSKKRKFNTPAASSSKKIKSDATRDTPSSTTPTAPTGKKTFRLLEVREILSTITVSEVPNEVDPRAVDHLRRATLQAWEQPMLAFINSINQEIQGTCERLLEDACSQWLTTAFFDEAKKIVRAFISEAMRKQLEHARRALTLEERKPFTVNTEGFKIEYDKEFKILNEGRITQRVVEKLEASDRATGKFIVEPSERKKKAKVDLKLRADLGDDPFAQEIEVMAKVRGYHNVALMRFLDHVVQGIQVEVLYDLENSLPQQLKAGLEVEGPNAQEHCKELLAEDREREVRRKNLKKERNNLIEALHKLARLGQVGVDI